MALTAWLAPSMLPVYLHTLRVRVRRHRHGHTRHPGDAAAVIRACIEACWNGRTFTASPGHFDMFWTRDLGFSTPSLVRLGEGERVRASLAYALGVWTRRRSHVTTTINYGERPADVFEYGVDSLPLLLAALRASDADDLLERHRDWLGAEVAWFARRVVDPGTGLVRADRTYSAHRDTVVNRSTAYGNTMVALLAKTLAETRWLPSPFERHFEGDYGRLLREHFWDGDRSATRSGTTRSRAKPTCGRSTQAWSATTACWLRRCDLRPTASGPVSAALRDDPAARPRGLVHRHVLPDYRAPRSGRASARSTSSCCGTSTRRRPATRSTATARGSSATARTGRSSTTAAGRGSARGACSSAKSPCSGRRSSSTSWSTATRVRIAEPECPRRRIGWRHGQATARLDSASRQADTPAGAWALVQKLADDLGIGIVVGNVEDGPPCRITPSELWHRADGGHGRGAGRGQRVARARPRGGRMATVERGELLQELLGRLTQSATGRSTKHTLSGRSNSIDARTIAARYSRNRPRVPAHRTPGEATRDPRRPTAGPRSSLCARRGDGPTSP